MTCTCDDENIKEHNCPYMEQFGEGHLCKCCPKCQKDCEKDLNKLKKIVDNDNSSSI